MRCFSTTVRPSRTLPIYPEHAPFISRRAVCFLCVGSWYGSEGVDGWRATAGTLEGGGGVIESRLARRVALGVAVGAES